MPKRILQPILLEEQDLFAVAGGARHTRRDTHRPGDPRDTHPPCGEAFTPRQFTWRGRRYLIESLSGEWRKLGRWWKGEPERRYLRAVTPEGLAFDICQDMKTGKWMLVGMED